MRWEELPMASRARLMAAAVRNGYTDIRSIKEAYASYQDLKLTTGNRYDEGGEFEVINLLDNVPVEYNTEDTWYTPLFIQNDEHDANNLFKNGGNKSKQSKRDYYKQQLIIRGLRGAQLEAVLNNMEVESGFNPMAYNKSSGARGLMQWLGSRKPKSWSEKDQLDYIARTYNQFGGDAWLDKSAYKRFNETTDAKEASYLFRRYWERPEKSSWHATDKFYTKGNKTTFLPDEVNDLVEQVSNLSYSEPKAPVFTEADLRLLDTSALAFYDPEYVDRNDPNYRSALAEAVALDESLDTPVNNWANWAAFTSMQLGAALDDPLSWMTIMASLNSKPVRPYKETTKPFQLFAPQGDDYLYHGLNFAAYGGHLFSNGGDKNKWLTDEDLLNIGWHWGDVSAVRSTDPLANTVKNKGDEKFIFDEDGNLVSNSAVQQYINSRKLPEIVITADNRKFNLKNYVLNKLQEKAFETIFPGLLDILTDPMESVVNTSDYSNSQTKNLQKKLQSDVLNSSYDPNFTAYAMTNPYVMKNSIFFNSANPLVRRFDDGGDITKYPVDNSQEIYASYEGPLVRAANNLFYPGGDMLLKDNAVNPLMQYVYGPEYEEIVRNNRNYIPSGNIVRNKPRYNIKQEADVVANTAGPTQRNINRKRTSESPTRKDREQQRYDDMMNQYRKERQGTISQAPDRMRHPDYDITKANQVQQRYEQNEIAEQNAYDRRVLEHNVLEGMEAIPWPSTIAGSLFNPNTHWYNPGSFFTNLYANDNRGFFNYNQATRDFYDENPEVGAVANLVGDFVVPGAAAKVLKGVGKVGKFAAADIGDAWKTMRYELAHPESQTYGIMANPFENLRNNPLFSKDARHAIRNKSERAIDNIANRMSDLDVLVNTPFGEINTTVHLPYSYYDNAKYPHTIDLNLGSDQTVFTRAIPMEGNFFVHQSSPNFFSPIEEKYQVSGKSGVTHKGLTVQNKFGKIEDTIDIPIVPATGEYPTPRSFNSGYSDSRIAISREGQVIPSPINFTADLGDVRAVGVEDAVRLPEGHPIREAARKYVNDLEKRIIDENGKPLATVEGSYRAVMNGLPHSPGDVELLMPASNMSKLELIFNVRGKRPLMSKTGYKVRADEFDALKEGSADFEVLQNGPNGGAIGKTSWLIYEKLHPNEAKALREKYSDTINSSGVRSYSAEPDWEVVELPISAEQLFDEYVTSGFYKLKYLRDTLVSGKEKHLTRMPSLELGEGVDSNEMLRTIKDIIHKEFPGSRTLKDLGYDLDYTNVEANKEFLKHFGIPEKYAENPTQMEMIVEQMIHAQTTIDRGSNMNIPFRGDMSFVNLPLELRKQLLITPTNANKMYNWSGPGGNSTNQFGKTSGNTGMSREMHIVKQLPLDYIEDMNGFLTDPEVMMAHTSKYKNPSDLVKRMNEIKDTSIRTEHEFQAVNSFDPKDVQATRDLARKYNLSFWTKDQPYGQSGNYVGILSPNDFAHDMRYVGDQPGGFEILKPLKFKLIGDNSWPMEAASAQRLQQNVFDEVMKNTDVTTALARQNKFRKAIKTMDNIDKTKDILKAVGQGTAIGVPAGGAIVGAGYYIGSIKDKRDPQKVQNAIDHTNSVLKALSSLDLAVTDAAVKSYALNNFGMTLEEYNKLSFEEKADIRYKAIVECNKNLRKFKDMLTDIAEHEKKAEERYSKTKEKRKKLKRMIGKSE